MMTSATMASAMGVARRPTHGSWRPLVTISVSLPVLSIVLPGLVMLDVGFSAMLASRSWPDEIPPSVPPASFLLKPSKRTSHPGVHCRAASPPRNQRPASTPLTALMLMKPCARSALELIENRLSQSRRYIASCEHADLRSDGVTLLAQFIHELSRVHRACSGSAQKNGLSLTIERSLRRQFDRAELRDITVNVDAELVRFRYFACDSAPAATRIARFAG